MATTRSTNPLVAKMQEANDFINKATDEENVSRLHLGMNRLGEKWGVSFVTGLGRSAYGVAKMATRLVLAALCFVGAIALGCFGEGEKACRATQVNLSQFSDGGHHLIVGVFETLQIRALTRTILSINKVSG